MRRQRHADDGLVERAEQQPEQDRAQDLELRAWAQPERGVLRDRGRLDAFSGERFHGTSFVALVDAGLVSSPRRRSGAGGSGSTRPRRRAPAGACAVRRGRSVARMRGCGPGRRACGPASMLSVSESARRPAAAGRTRTTRRSPGTRTRSIRPCSSIRSMIPVAFDSETPSSSASRLIGHLAMVLEQPQDVHLAHAHVALDEAAHGGAAQLADPATDFCQDGVDVGGLVGWLAGAR